MPDETLPRNESEATQLKRLYEMDVVEAMIGPNAMEWFAAQDLLALYEKHQQGDQGAVLAALYHCMRDHLPIPIWCEKAYIKGFERVSNGDAMSWDGAFGTPYPKGTHQSAIQNQKKSWRVATRVLELHAKGHPIDNQLYERVGRELGIGGKTTTQNLYKYFFSAYNNSRRAEAIAKIKGLRNHGD